MLRTHTCGELRSKDIGQEVTLAGWGQRIRDKGGLIWIDVRDSYGITQLLIEPSHDNANITTTARTLGREFVIQAKGKVIKRISKNTDMLTGDIEVQVSALTILNASLTPPFTIEDDTDGGEDLRMRYRYLDLRRNLLQKNLRLRHQVTAVARHFLDKENFIDIETPALIRSSPEGARDFVVPSRVESNHFYALPQSPQMFKQLLMVSGFDRYYQIVKCFRDEDLRADRQPEFTQIDCEMSFVEKHDVLRVFEDFIRHIFLKINKKELPVIPHISYKEAMSRYGTDKPDIRFDMTLVDLTSMSKGHGFTVFDHAEIVIGLCVPQGSQYSRKQIDALTEYVKQPQIGGKGLIYLKCNEDGSYKSSVDKWYTKKTLYQWAQAMGLRNQDMALIMSGEQVSTRKAMGNLRLHVADQMGLRNNDDYAPLWVTDFPLFEWDNATERFYAQHHPFTAPQAQYKDMCDTNPEQVKADAYDMVINGVEVGGGSIRIHDKKLQQKIFNVLGLSNEEAQEQFGFLMEAFQYGAPPHGGIAFGLDRFCALLSQEDSIRNFIAFPKNNAGRDTMMNAPSILSKEQQRELGLN